MAVAQRTWRCAQMVVALIASTHYGAAALAEVASVSFHREVLPLLRSRCQGCHQPARSEGGVDLTSLAGMTAAADSGLVAVTPGDVDASELLAQVTPDESGEALMPQQGPPLSAAEIDLLRRWIAAGAKIDAGTPRPMVDAEHPPTYITPATISALDTSPNGRWIAVSGVNETLVLDAPAAMRGEAIIVRRLIGMAERIESLKFSPDGTQLAVAGGLPGESGELQIWDVATGALVASHMATSDTLRGVAWSPDGTQVAYGGADTNLYVIDAATGARLLEQGAHADWVMASAFSNDGKFVVSGSRDQTLKLIETSTGRFVDNITAVSPNVPGGMVFAVARHPRLELMAVGGSEGVPRTYLVHRLVERKIGDDNNLVRAYPAMPGRIFAVAFSPDGRHLAAAASDGEHGRVDVFAIPEVIEPPEDVKLIQGKVVDTRTPEEATRLAAYHREGAVRLAYTPTTMGPAYAVAFLADGKAIASGGADGVLRLHSAEHGTLLAELTPFPLGEKVSDGGPSPVAVSIPVTTTPQTSPAANPDHDGLRSVEFLTDVMPVLAKAGCNAGTCHGSRAGQNGFALSLRGYDPYGDYRALTDDLAGRRINRARPESSLMLLKATGAVPHAGGVRMEPASRHYEILRSWIANGARYHPDAPRVVSLALSPVNPVVQQPGESLAVKVTATFTDGSVRDVTADAFVESGDTETATADATGVLTAVRRGEAAILARYEGAYAATTLTVMGDRTGFAWSAPPAYNRIDEFVDAKLLRMKILPSGLCTDEQFLRRVHLDVTGLPPRADDVRAFLADPRPPQAKREAIVEALIGSDDYIEHWTNRWADLLMVNGKYLGPEGAAAYRAWIRQAVADNKPYDEFVRDILTASGSTREHPAASYFKALRAPDAIAETTTQVFLGVRFNCNKCHDHPFERWTQNDYYGWAAFFSHVRLQKDPEAGDRTIPGSAVEAAQPLYEIVDDGGAGAMMHLRTGKPATPRFPYESAVAGEVPAELRRQAAAWLTSADNRYFAASFVNRVWAHLTGVGLIEPIDDIRAGNPPTNPELLAWLTEEFVANGFDVQHLIRTICTSRTYQLSPDVNRWNEDDRRNYSHALPRRLPAESLYDAVHRAVGSTSHLPGVPPGARAAALPDSMLELESGLLSKLGRPARESGCECERSSDLQLGPVMALLNGPTFADAIDDSESELAQLVAATPDDNAVIEEVFLRVLGRAPTRAEQIEAKEYLAAPREDQAEVARALAAHQGLLAAGFDRWRSDNRPVTWSPLTIAQAEASNGAGLEVRSDGSIFASGEHGKGVYVIVAAAPLEIIRGLRLEVMTDDRLPAAGPGRADNGNFVLSEIRVIAVLPDRPDARRKLKIRTADADFSQAGYHVSGAIDGNPESGWAISGGIGRPHEAAFTFSRPIACPPGTSLIVELDQQYGQQHELGRFRLSVTADASPLVRPQHPDEWRSLLAAAPGTLSDDETERLRNYYFSLDSEYRQLQRAVAMVANPRLAAVQDLAWALINSPAFLFNH